MKLEASLLRRPPAAFAVGRGNVLVLEGTCDAGRRRLRSLSVALGERVHPVDAFGMRRPGGGAAWDAWWAFVPVEPLAGNELAPLRLHGELAGGELVESEELATIELLREVAVTPSAHAFPDGQGPAVSICMATYEPDPRLLRRQLDSIRAQTHERWTCVISDDGSSPAALDAIRDAIGGDQRFELHSGLRRLGFYANFERALALAPPGAELIGFADQDDAWHPDKLETLIGALRDGATLAYSDMRIVGEDGEVRSETYWTHRRNNYTDITSLLVANTITGAASLFRADLLVDALPFPPGVGAAYHDQWVALVALARGEIAYVERSLYDYVQHGAAALGHERANQSVLRRTQGSKVTQARARLERAADLLTEAGWRGLYFDLFARTRLFAGVLEMRIGDRIGPAKRVAIARLAGAEASARTVAWLTARSVRDLRGTPVTIGRERLIVLAVLWRRALGALSRLHRSRPRR